MNARAAAGFERFAEALRAEGFANDAVLDAMRQSKRDRYLQPDDAVDAFGDGMLPLACGQATERVRDAAWALAALDVRPGLRVLDLGTGSGFVAEVLARLGARVVTVDRYRTLLNDAKDRHAEREVETVSYAQRDALALTDVDGPFDRIYSSIAFEAPPKPLTEHLVAEGVLVAPVGPPEGPQMITRLQKIGVRFDRTPLRAGWFAPAEPGVALAL